MPRDPSIRKVLVIGSGPIVIGQAAEFDYSGSQACRALREEGVEVVLVNSNPATIMTDLETADQVYIEPLNLAHLEAIIARERPDGLLATLGGQTGLNLAVRLAEEGILERYGVKILGTSYHSIRQAEDRELFKELMEELGIPVPRSQVVYSPKEALGFAEEVGYPVIVRPGYTLGGTGGGICHTPQELEETVARGLVHSLNNQCLVEESVLGLKEIEWEVMRDRSDNCITVCDMENLDPMGVHTGDSIVVAPSLTLTDPEYQFLRSKALAIIRALKIEGGCNIQFALDPQSGRYYVIEVNPRVSRSSALASKATGYPIARVAAKIALGLALDEIENRVTGKTRASFEPALDYVVVKFPKWPFDKFREADRTLGTQMKATGEVMAIDRTFEGAFMKALWSLEVKLSSLRTNRWKRRSDEELRRFIRLPTDGRMFAILEALHRGFSVEEISELSKIDPYFIRCLKRLVRAEQEFYTPALTPEPALVAEGTASSVEEQGGSTTSGDGEGGGVPTKAEALRELLARAGETASERERHALRRAIGELGIDLAELKALGFSDQLIMAISGLTHEQLSLWKRMFNVRPVYKAVDTCAAEFAASTPYYYSTWATMDDRSTALDGQHPTDRGAVVVIGSGPIRIGQGIEFDYCSVHAVMALRRMGFRAVMVNNNPETVSTDYDVSDALYFEPLTLEHVLEVVRRERALGVICQFGGQTAINLAGPLAEAGVRLLGTDLEGIDLTEDREKFDRLLEELGISRPPGLATADYDQAVREARRIGFPVLVRPSYVLGGRAMRIIHSEEALREWIEQNRHAFAGKPILIDKFIRGREVEVDLITDGETVVIPGLMEHIERAGVHSGDSMAVYPPQTLTLQEEYQVVQSAIRIARAIKARGLMNIQFVLTSERLYVLEVNPRASRTVPFMSKITGVPMVALATRAIMGEITGQRLRDLGVMGGLYAEPGLTAVKAPVFSSSKLTRTEVELGPEMKSTGEVMGIGRSYYEALRKAMVAAGISLPEASPVSWQQNGMEDEKRPGSVLITVADRDKAAAVPIAWGFSQLGFSLYATRGTASYLRGQGIEVEEVKKISEGRPHIVDLIHEDRFALVVNTVSDNQQAEREGLLIRRAAVERGIPLMTSLDTAAALLRALRATAEGLATGVSVTPLSAIRSRYPDL